MLDTIGATACSRNVNFVTMPKLPPPPRSAHISSGCSRSFDDGTAGDLPCALYSLAQSARSRDQLNKLYAKLDVKSRSELVSRLFFDEYRPRELAGLPLDGHGWFIGEQPSP